jgi:hypothetical protein
MPKKKWMKPKLIVLIKGRPEEAVLQQCKGDGGWYGATSSENDCLANWGWGCVIDCSVNVPS